MDEESLKKLTDLDNEITAILDKFHKENKLVVTNIQVKLIDASSHCGRAYIVKANCSVMATYEN